MKKAPYETDLLWRTLRALKRPGRARTVELPTLDEQWPSDVLLHQEIRGPLPWWAPAIQPDGFQLAALGGVRRAAQHLRDSSRVVHRDAPALAAAAPLPQDLTSAA
jgi:hypothetical protein